MTRLDVDGQDDGFKGLWPNDVASWGGLQIGALSFALKLESGYHLEKLICGIVFTAYLAGICIPFHRIFYRFFFGRSMNDFMV